jgi:hypothetical protein
LDGVLGRLHIAKHPVSQRVCGLPVAIIKSAEGVLISQVEELQQYLVC